jgi:thioredoxin reductase (NADPH)
VTAAGSGCAAAIDAERWLADNEESSTPAQGDATEFPGSTDTLIGAPQ